MSISIVSPFFTDDVPPVLVTWIVVSATTLYTTLAALWAAAVVPLTPRVTVSVQGPLPLTFVTVICSFSIWIVSPFGTEPPVTSIWVGSWTFWTAGRSVVGRLGRCRGRRG